MLAQAWEDSEGRSPAPVAVRIEGSGEGVLIIRPTSPPVYFKTFLACLVHPCPMARDFCSPPPTHPPPTSLSDSSVPLGRRSQEAE